MKNVVFTLVLLSLLAFACTDNPFFTLALDIPYSTSYTIKASKQEGLQLVLESDEDSYSEFVAEVEDQLEANNIKGEFSASITSLELSIPEQIELDWSVLENVSIEFTVNGESSDLFDEIVFPNDNTKTISLELPESGFSINDFLSYETAHLRIVADLNTELTDDVPVEIDLIVEVSTEDEPTE